MSLHESVLSKSALPGISLANWQDGLQKAILSPNTGHKNTIYPLLKQQGEIAKHRLDIYINAYVLRLIDALRTNYPVIYQLIGDDYFDVMACRYLKQYPPAHASIRWFGEHLSSFLKSEKPYTNVPSMAELADFEWALRHTIDAADIDIVTPEKMQAIAPEAWAGLTFDVHPSLTVLKFDWNTPQIWSALSVENTDKQETPEPILQPGLWIVYRQPDLVSAWRSITPLEVAALESVYHGLNFADLCEELCNLVDDAGSVPLIAATFLRAWVEQGLVGLRK